MKKLSGKTVLCLLFFLITDLSVAIDISGPSGKLSCSISEKNNELLFSVSMNGKAVIEPSFLKLSLDEKLITSGIKIGKEKKTGFSEIYPLFGLHSTGSNIYKGVIIPLAHKTTQYNYNIEVRVFKDAVAFRFVLPGKDGISRTPDELTIFRLPSKSLVWYHDLYMHYEGVHQKKLLDTIPEGQWAAPPLTIKLQSGGYASITEANLVNYPGLALQSDGENGFAVRLGHCHPASYPYILRYKDEEAKRLSRIAEIKGSITTPWRVIIAGEDLNTMVNSDAITSLCPEPDRVLFPEGATSDWLKPGRAVWKYLDGGGDGTLTTMKKFSREAAELGFEYNILEGFWSKWPDDSVKALVDYSGELGIGIIVWVHSNTLHNPAARKDLFQRCHDLGIAGLKIDFFDHEAMEVIDLYETILRETAEQKLICIFHGANKPTGLWRTWPNAMVYEAVKGMEASKLIDRATHETTIPFTRMLAGPADYSVCHFGTRRQNTTWTHQVATSAIFSAPVITYAATPEHILENPCADMIKSIPAVWEETIVLQPSEIGELAIYAQRNRNTWFLSVINGLQSRTINIPLSFLKKIPYRVLFLKDDPENPAAVITSTGEARKDMSLEISLTSGGGFMARFEEIL